MGIRSKKTSTQRQRSVKIPFKDVKGVWCELYVPPDTDSVHIAVLRRASKIVPGYYGRELPDDIREGLDGLPLYLRKKIIKAGWVKGKPDEVIPTLLEWLDFCLTSGKITSIDREKLNYFLEYHGNKRLDQIDTKESEGFRPYMNRRKKRKGNLDTPHSEVTINKAIQIGKRVFEFAVKAKHISDNPYENVVGGRMNNPDSYERVFPEVWQSSVETIPNDTSEKLELRGIHAIARWQGLRIMSEIRNLKFADFEFESNGNGTFVVKGKKGRGSLRRIPIFPRFLPYYNAIRSAAPAEQVYVFEYYRLKNPVKLIQDHLERAGVARWKQFMHNQRRSFINDLVDLGWSESDITAVCGNTPEVRELFYYFKRSKEQLAAMGGAGGSSSGLSRSAPPFAPPFPLESDDSVEWRQWQEAVVETTICRPFDLSIPAGELLDSWESSYELKQACEEINSMMTTICDFSEGKISVEEADKRIDDHSYRAAWFRDEGLKKALCSAQEKGANCPKSRLGRT